MASARPYRGARHPFAPLERKVGIEESAVSVVFKNQSRQIYYRAREVGWLTTEHADRLATEMRLTPLDIWGWEWVHSEVDEPLCRWCRGEADYRSDFCSDECYRAQLRERKADLRRLYRHEARCEAISARVAAMTPGERETWLCGDPGVAEAA